MSTAAKTTVTNIFTALVLLLTGFQGMIPAIPINNPATITLVSAIVLFLVTGLTAWKQALSVEINNGSLMPTLIVAILATLGGLNDLFGVIHFSEITGQWIRFGITFIIMGLNLISKMVWPTELTKSSI